MTSIPPSALDELAGTVLESVEHADALAHRLFGEHPESRTSNGLYTVSDADNVVYVNAGTVTCAIGLRDPDDPPEGLAALRSADGAWSSPYEGGNWPPASIRERPPEAEGRAVSAHWEGDLLAGAAPRWPRGR